LNRPLAIIAFALASLAAHAGRPLSTEDAATLEDKACQVEAWIDRSRVETRAWAVPACNFGWGIEWQAGFARTRAEGHSEFSESYLQGKKVLGAIAGGKHARLESLHEKTFRARVGSPSVIRPVTVDALQQRNEIAHVSPSPDRVIDRGLERFCERCSLSLIAANLRR